MNWTWWKKPIVKLTAGYVLIIMVISIMFSLVIYQTTTAQVRASFPPQPRFYTEFGELLGPDSFNQQFSHLFEARYHTVAVRLQWSLLFVNLFVLGGSTVLSYFLAKRQLRPIEQALTDQRQFTADASHELRTPLTAMKAEIEVALNGLDQKEHRRVLSSNLEEIARLERLSTSLLKLARHETDSLKLELTTVDLAQAVAEATQRLAGKIAAKKITVSRDKLAGMVWGEHEAVVDLVTILMDNAVKYSAPAGSVELIGNWSRQHMTLSVIDHGIGISAADLPHVFRRFYRSDRARSKEGSNGFGLGLSIAKQIAERIGGDITIASNLGEGTAAMVTMKALTT